jgi:hypothetical protein
LGRAACWNEVGMLNVGVLARNSRADVLQLVLCTLTPMRQPGQFLTLLANQRLPHAGDFLDDCQCCRD